MEVEREPIAFLTENGIGISTRRSDILICDTILDISDEGANMTKILYEANLNYRQLQKYLEFLIQCNMLKKRNYDEYLNGIKRKENGIKIIYSTTEKGREFLILVEKIKSLFQLEQENLELL